MSNRPPKHYYSLQSFARYIGRYRTRFILIGGLFVIANALLAIIPIFIGKLVGRWQPGRCMAIRQSSTSGS